MGERNLGDFYARCDAAHREFYSVVIREWGVLGLPWAWHDDDLALIFRSATRDRVLPLFLLCPGRDIYPASLRLDLRQWAEWIGKEESDRISESLATIPGLSTRRQGDELVIDNPGHLSGPVQQRLRDSIKGLGFRIHELVGA